MIETEVHKLHTLLKEKIDETGYTPLEVEETLGWENVTIAQLLDGEEEMRVRQVLVILDRIGVEPKTFFAEIYGLAAGDLSAELAELKALVGSVANLLVDNGVVTTADLASAVAAQVNIPR